MKVWWASLGVGLLALVIQGALATVLAPPWCPDLGLLLVLCLGLRWRGLAVGLALAFVLGFSADLLSGSLLGQHALLRLVAFASAFVAGRQLNLRGGVSLVAFVSTVTFVYGIAVALLSGFFLDTGWPPASKWFDALIHSVVNGLAAPWVLAGVNRLSVWAGDEDGAVRSLPIEPHRRTL